MSLFIGGPADGEHRAVYDNSPACRIREMPPLPTHLPENAATTLKSTDHVYLRTRMTNGHNHVYLHESIDPSLIVDILISGYRNPSSPFKRP